MLRPEEFRDTYAFDNSERNKISLPMIKVLKRAYPGT